MVKKAKRTIDVDSDGDYDHFSEESDASFTLTSNKKRSRKTGVAPSKRQRVSNSIDKSKTSQPVNGHTTKSTQDFDGTGIPHAKSTHVIADPVPLQKALLAWYADVHETRGMPWRKPYDATLNREQRAQRAYEVWISEIMLQQTQVVTVIPYYNKWMARFPTIKDLAAADIETVNALWKGLGYYSRAARLLSAAKKVVQELGGFLPNNAKDMEAKIPGIGRYSAGAICSIAYNECAPVLDGNVNRLLSRVLALHANPKAKTTLDILWTGAEAMVRRSEHAGDINQALIELGATVCKVRDPGCISCPLRQWCRAYRYEHDDDLVPSSSDHTPTTNEVPDIEELCNLCELLPTRPSVTAFPMKVDRKKAREELDIVNVVEWRHHPGSQDRWFLLVKRPEGGLLAGLHEFPTQPDVSKALSTAAMHDTPHRLLSDLLTVPLQPYKRTAQEDRLNRDPSGVLDGKTAKAGDLLRIVNIMPAGDVTHIFSHIRKTYRIQWVVLEGGKSDPPSLMSRPSDLDIGERKARKAQKTKTMAASLSSTRTGRGKNRTKGSEQLAEPDIPSNSDTTEPKVIGAASESIGGELLLDAEGPPQFTARWLKMSDVPEANIGTGVLKVWKQVSTLWATEVE